MELSDLFEYFKKSIITLVSPSGIVSLYSLCKQVNDNNIQGALVETGVYKGGTALTMALANKSMNMNRTIWLFDSYEGIPTYENLLYEIPPKKPGDRHEPGEFSASKQEVIYNFKICDLWDDNIKLVKGWFKDTLPNCSIDKIAILHFDGDQYSSTLEVLYNLYDKVTSGGYIIIDDYCIPSCKEATNRFLEERNLEPIMYDSNHLIIDKTKDSPCAMWWKKE